MTQILPFVKRTPFAAVLLAFSLISPLLSELHAQQQHMPAAIHSLPAHDERPREQLIAQALLALDAYSGIEAKLREQIDLFDKQLAGAGGYWQQGRGADRRFRLELTMQIDEQTSSLLQVNDARYLWIHQDLLGDSSLGRVELARIRTARRLAEQGARPTSSLHDTLALGGLPGLLAGLNDCFVFSEPREGELDQVPVWILSGSWRPDLLATMLPAQKAAIETGGAVELSSLPPQAPEQIVVMLGREDLFPYRLEFRRSPKPGKNAAPAKPDEPRLMALLELYEVRFGGQILSNLLRYEPGDQKFRDDTPRYLERMGLKETP